MKCTSMRIAILLAAAVFAFAVGAQHLTNERPNDLLAPHAAPLDASLLAANAKVNLVYLVPSDRTVRQEYLAGMEAAARSLRAWYAAQLATGRTFNVTWPVVRVVQLPHNADYYSSHINANGDLFSRFWNNVLDDAFPRTGGGFNDPQNVWAYYIDANPKCGQCGGCGTSGVLVVPANDLRGLAGLADQNVSPCPNEGVDRSPVNRWIGGLGHELGHAFGLPHPPGCDQGLPSCDGGALMWSGYGAYPNTYLRTDEKNTIRNSPYLSGSAGQILLGQRFAVDVHYRNQFANPPAQGVLQGRSLSSSSTSDTAIFTFDNPNVVELMVRLSDARPFENRIHTYYGGLSDIEFFISVADMKTGKIAEYRKAPNEITGAIDRASFTAVESGPVSLEDAIDALTAEHMTMVPNAASSTLNLLGGRYEVRMRYRNQFANPPTTGYLLGESIASSSSTETAVFFFQDRQSVEWMLRFSDARPYEDRIHLFHGGLSDIEFTIEVFDTVTGTRREYAKAPNTLRGGVDRTTWVVSGGGPPAPANMLTNPAFNNGMTGWNALRGAAMQDGRVMVSRLTGADKVWDTFLYQQFTVRGGDQLSFGGTAMTSAATEDAQGAAFLIDFNDGGGGYFSTQAPTRTYGSSQLTGTVTVPGPVGVPRTANFHAVMRDIAGLTVWVDDVYVRKTN